MGSYIGVVKYLNTYNRMSHGKTIEYERFFGRRHKTALVLLKLPSLQRNFNQLQPAPIQANISELVKFKSFLFWFFGRRW